MTLTNKKMRLALKISNIMTFRESCKRREDSLKEKAIRMTMKYQSINSCSIKTKEAYQRIKTTKRTRVVKIKLYLEVKTCIRIYIIRIPWMLLSLEKLDKGVSKRSQQPSWQRSHTLSQRNLTEIVTRRIKPCQERAMSLVKIDIQVLILKSNTLSHHLLVQTVKCPKNR